jgi:hypothetical protein
MSPVSETIKIKSGFLKGDFCNYAYEYVSGPTAGDEVKRSGSLIVHNDMKEAFKKLHPHLCVICEEVPVNKIKNIEGIASYDEDIHKPGGIEDVVSRFSVDSFERTSEGVKLAGTKKLSTGKFISLKTPEIELEGNYSFINELWAAIDELTQEIEEYMTGKSAPKYEQGELGFDGNDDNGDLEGE